MDNQTESTNIEKIFPDELLEGIKGLSDMATQQADIVAANLIWNYGGLPAAITPENIENNHASFPRNKNLAFAFYKAGFIDTWGRGFQKIRNGFEAEGIPMPKVENFCGGVQVSIERTNFIKMSHVVSDVGSFVGS